MVFGIFEADKIMKNEVKKLIFLGNLQEYFLGVFLWVSRIDK
jgi:hypothetical protein